MTERHINHLCLAGVLGEVSPQWNCQWCPWHATNGCALLCRHAVPAGADVFHMLRLLGPWSFAWSRWAWLDSGLVEPHGFLRPGSSVRSIVSKWKHYFEKPKSGVNTYQTVPPAWWNWDRMCMTMKNPPCSLPCLVCPLPVIHAVDQTPATRVTYQILQVTCMGVKLHQLYIIRHTHKPTSVVPRYCKHSIHGLDNQCSVIWLFDGCYMGYMAVLCCVCQLKYRYSWSSIIFAAISINFSHVKAQIAAECRTQRQDTSMAQLQMLQEMLSCRPSRCTENLLS